MDKVAEKYGPEGLESYVVLLQDNQGNPPSTAFCTAWAAQNKSNFTKVLIDPLLKTAIYGGKETSLVTNEDGEIIYKVHGDYHVQLEAKIIQELAD